MAAGVGDGSCVAAVSRGDLIAQAALYLRPPRDSGGSVAALRLDGAWRMRLRSQGEGEPTAQMRGGYRFAAGAELTTAARLDAAPEARIDAFLDFTADADPPGGLHYVAALSTAPATRFALSMLGEGAGFFSLSLKLPGDVVLEDRSMIYPVGARVRGAIGADFSTGTGYLTQTGFVRQKPFAPPGSLRVQQVRLGAACQITLHEIAVFAG